MQTAQGVLSHQSEMQNGYGTTADAQQMWNGTGQMQSTDYCGVPMQAHYQCMQPEVQNMQQPPMMMPGMPMLPQMAVQQPQMLAMAQSDQSPMSQMQMPQMQTQQLQLPQMAMSNVHTPTASGECTPTTWVNNHLVASGASTPTEVARRECMAMLMPQSSQFFPCDQANLAAQLQQMAESQGAYED